MVKLELYWNFNSGYIVFKTCIVSHTLFFFSFLLFPLGVATASHMYPNYPIFCIFFSHTNYLHVLSLHP